MSSRSCKQCGAAAKKDDRYCHACGSQHRPGVRVRSAFVLFGCLVLDVLVAFVALIWVALASASQTDVLGATGPSQTAVVAGFVWLVASMVAVLAWQTLRVVSRGRLPRVLRWCPSGVVPLVAFPVQFVVLIAFWMPASPASSSVTAMASRGPGGRIAFISDRGRTDATCGCGDLYVMRADGAHARLVHGGDPGGDWDVAWSPAGDRIGFSAGQSGNGTSVIETIRPDGSGLERLTRGNRHDWQPAWSPDDHTIAFISDARDGAIAATSGGLLTIIPVSGGRPRVLVSMITRAQDPSWSPNGQRLAFASGGSIYLVDRDGTHLHRLTAGYAPSWSPLGDQIAFDRGDGIYLIHPDATQLRKIETGTSNAAHPAWAPDGRIIAFAATDANGNDDIYAIQTSGGTPRRITSDPAAEGDPAWTR